LIGKEKGGIREEGAAFEMDRFREEEENRSLC